MANGSQQSTMASISHLIAWSVVPPSNRATAARLPSPDQRRQNLKFLTPQVFEERENPEQERRRAR
jgi:hypothetical protein